MKRYLYLSLIPESLILSQLSPEEFGSYYAIGAKKRSRDPALFFEVDEEQSGEAFKLSEAALRCIPHSDGHPRRSIYVGIYRALERIPLSALGKLHLATGDGRVLSLERGAWKPINSQEHHLYQELCPVKPRIVSKLEAVDFCQSITNPENLAHLSSVVFCEMHLNKLARDPGSSDVDDLPYENIGHLRDCLRELETKPRKQNKIVNRSLRSDFLFRSIKNGIFVGNVSETAYYPMPPLEKLEREHFEWWRSAQNT